MELVKLSSENKSEIKELFKSVFMSEPWNDDWSDENQLDAYICDLTGNNNSLTLGLVEQNKIIGVAMGAVKHWYSGTEYYIEELFIARDLQGRGTGTKFLAMIEDYLKQNNICRIFLQTESDMPAYSFYAKNNFVELKKHVSFIKEL